MSPNEIEVGRTYVNRGAGRTKRTVLAIGKHVAPTRWLGADSSDPATSGQSAVGVEFEQSGKVDRLYLTMFAKWAGKEAS